jgi:hypothetical protein
MRSSACIAFASVLMATATATYAEPTGGAAANSQLNRERIVCRRFLRTGSLVDSYRTCKTNREWQHEHENLQHLGVSDSCGRRGEGGAGCNQ